MLIVFIPALAAGFAAGMWLSWQIEANPIAISTLMGDPSMDAVYEDMGFKPMLYALVDTQELLIGLLSLLVPSLVFIFFATRRIFRLKPAEIISTI